MRFVIFELVMAVGILPSAIEGQSLSLFRALPGAQNSYASLVDATGVYVFDDSFRKFDRDGAAVWTRPYPSGRTPAWLTSAAAGVYVAGHTGFGFGSSQNPEAFVTLHDMQGNEVWSRQFGFATSVTFNRAVAADETGVYIAGDVTGLLGSKTLYLRKYDDRGTESWTKTYEVPDYGIGLAAVPGGVYFRTQLSLRKYDQNGTEVWVRPLDGSSIPFDMKANASGLYLTGYDKAKGYFLSRHDSSGNELWIRYGQSGLIALDANSVYVTAYTFREPGQCASGSEDALVVRYDTDGNTLWSRQFGTYRHEFPRSIAADSTGVFVAGFGSDVAFLAKLEQSAAASTTEPRIQNECVVNAASYVGGAVSPGEIVTIFGSAIGPAQLVAARGDRTFETVLAETRVLFDGLPSPLLYASAKQVSVVVPNAVAGKSSVGIQVEYRGVLSKAVTLAVLPTHLGVFSSNGSGSGQRAVLNEDGTLNSPTNPAKPDSTISIFATGGGVTNPETLDGAIVGNPPPRLNGPVRAYFPYDSPDGYTDLGVAATSYASAVTGFVGGLVQVNVRLPESLPSGEVLLHLAVGEGEGGYQVIHITVSDR